MMTEAAATISSETARREITEFFKGNYKLVIGFLINVCRCPDHQADDIAQDSFLAVRGRWDHVRGLDEPKAYLFKVAKRRFGRLQKSAANQYKHEDPDVYLTAVPDPADAFAEADDRLDVYDLVRQLPSGQRQILWLRQIAGLSEAQTAGILSVSPGTEVTVARC